MADTAACLPKYREGVAKDGACSCADYMLVMAMEGDNVAHKLHQEVLFLLSIFPLSISLHGR